MEGIIGSDDDEDVAENGKNDESEGDELSPSQPVLLSEK